MWLASGWHFVLLFYLMPRKPRKPGPNFASVKLTRPFAEWLKLQAAERRRHMYQVVEDLVAEGSSGKRRPWERS